MKGILFTDAQAQTPSNTVAITATIICGLSGDREEIPVWSVYDIIHSA